MEGGGRLGEKPFPPANGRADRSVAVSEVVRGNAGLEKPSTESRKDVRFSVQWGPWHYLSST